MQLEANKEMKVKKEDRNRVDLICVVDISSSMDGDKIKEVKDSLRYMIKVLREIDRIAIVTFNESATVLLNLTENSDENKPLIKKNISDL